MSKRVEEGEAVGPAMRFLLHDAQVDAPFFVRTSEDRWLDDLRVMRHMSQSRRDGDGEVLEFLVMASDPHYQEHMLHWAKEGETTQLQVRLGYIKTHEIIALGYGNM